MHRRLLVVALMKRLLFLVLIVGLVATVQGVAAATPATTATPVTCGDEITQSGTYVLSGDCTAVGETGLVIFASNVTLELAGHTITGPNTATNNNGIAVSGSGDHIEGPGTITGFSNGITFDGVTKSVITQVTTTHNFQGINVSGTGDRIVDNTSLNNHIYDLSDSTAGCDHNQWHANNFATANQTCIS